ncbi:MAG: MipA/OmpV family protein [Deltaproteobacteria bacterium]|jgi:outer membrane scaffolding protein for murein synthesis (MipA/OmpV family)|nr:MipA/OmpV family protein [Deltaproteobacteria bacterium]
MTCRITFTVFALGICLLATGARAQVFDEGFDGGTYITGSIGFGVLYGPEFEGGRHSELSPLPFFNLKYGPVFLSTSKGLGIKFDFLSGTLELAPALNYRMRRDEDDSPLLKGLGDVDDALTIGGTATLRLEDVFLSLKAFQGLSDQKGLEVEMQASYVNTLGDNLHWSLGAFTSLADTHYLNTYFGITGEQSLRSGYPVYTLDSGFKDVGFGGAIDYYLSPSFSVDLFARYRYLIGDAADSPIVQRGSEGGVQAGLVLFYHFGPHY